MVQPHPAGQVEEAPVEAAAAAAAQQAPGFDPVLVRDFFNYLLVGLEGGDPKSSKVTCWSETAALGLNYWRESGMLVIVTAIWPLSDAIPMSKFLRKMADGAAEWEVLNLGHLVAVAGVTSTLLNLGKELRGLRNLLKGYKSKGAVVENTEKWLLSHNLTEAAAGIEDKIPGIIDAASSVEIADLRRDALAMAEQAKTVVKTVREAAASGAFLPAKPLHQTIKKAHRDLQILLKATPVDLPYANPFDV